MRNRKRVFYNSHGDEDFYAMIRAAAGDDIELMLLERDDDNERIEKLETADAAVVASTRFTTKLIAAAPALAIVHHQGVGYHDTIDLPALAARNIPLAITPGGTAESVAEQTIMFILAALRLLPYADSELREGRFHINALRPITRDLHGRTVGLLGLGRIGKAVAQRLLPFGVKLIYRDIVDPGSLVEAALHVEPVSFEELLARSDILSLHVPVTPLTHKLMNRKSIAQMQKGSYLINTCRGKVLDEAALVEAIESGHLAGAAVDVFDPEPPPDDHPLFRFKNVVVTPHISAGTRDAFVGKMTYIFANLDRFWRDETVENLIDLSGETRA